MFCFPTADNAMLPYKSFKYCTIQVHLRAETMANFLLNL